MTRYRAAEREQILAQTRRRLLDAALAEFSRAGFDAANVEQIAAAAGFAKGTVYNHFPSKRSLMEALITEIGAEHLEVVRAGVLAESEPAARLRAFFRAGFAFVSENLAQARLSLALLNNPDPEFNAWLYGAYLPMFALVAEEILEPGVAAGIFRPCQAETTAALVMTLYLGSAASVDPAGRPYMDPEAVADFALGALAGAAGDDPQKA